MGSAPVVFIHGMFMTGTCWEAWAERYQAAGRSVMVFEWPHRDAPVAEIRAKHPDAELGRLTLERIVHEHAARIQSIPDPPVLVGHSMGGLIVQLLLDRGLGSAGVAIDSAPPQGVFSARWSFLKSNWPMISPFARAYEPRLIPFTDFQYAFANTLPEEVQRTMYERYVVPESRLIPRQSLTRVAHVDFAKEHAPLLFVAGGADHIIPESLNAANHARYSAPGSTTAFKAFDGRDHLTIVEPGWEQVADYVLGWLDGLAPGSSDTAR
jgi:pimeloyl-ACP methyl ester carboxylesterase